MIPKNLHITKYSNIVEWFSAQHGQSPKTEVKQLKTTVAGVPHVFAWGGVHGAIKGYHGVGQFINMDVTSLYPSLMIGYGLLSRNVTQPEKFKKIYKQRLAYKAAGDPRQAALKLVINSAYGVMKDGYNGMYDPRQANNVCLHGQLLILDLIEHLEPFCELIQSNTDGVLVRRPDNIDGNEWQMKIDAVTDEWQQRTGLKLEFDKYVEIWQRDVNNYMVKTADGGYKSTGVLKKLSSLDYNLPIVTKAMTEWLLNETPIADTINACNDLREFQMVCKIGKAYDYMQHGDDRLDGKCVRVFASLDHKDGGLRKHNKETGRLERVATTPDNLFIDNGAIVGKTVPLKLNRDWYIKRAKDILASFQSDPNEQLELEEYSQPDEPPMTENPPETKSEETYAISSFDELCPHHSEAEINKEPKHLAAPSKTLLELVRADEVTRLNAPASRTEIFRALYTGYVPMNISPRNPQTQKAEEKRPTEYIDPTQRDGKPYATYEETTDWSSVAGVNRTSLVYLDFDDGEQAAVLLRLIIDKKLQCVAIRSWRGIHVIFTNDGSMENSKAGMTNCLGLSFDVKIGGNNTLDVVRENGWNREILYCRTTKGEPQQMPIYFRECHVKAGTPLTLWQLGEGARDNTLHDHVWRLVGEGFSHDQMRDTVKYVNRYVLADPLDNRQISKLTSLKEYNKARAKIGAERDNRPVKGNRDVAPKDIVWSSPISLDKPQLPSFPIEAFPPQLRDYANAVAVSQNVPVDMVASNMLGVLAAVNQKRYEIDIRADWSEPLNLYILIVTPPSGGKSRTHTLIVKPFVEFQHDYNQEHAIEFANNKDRIDILQAEKESLKKNSKQNEGKDIQAELTRINTELAECEKVRPLKMYTTNATSEAIEVMMANNNEEMAVLASESTQMDILKGAYSKNVNLATFLQAYSGDPISTDRLSRAGVDLVRPALTMTISTQSEDLKGIVSNKSFTGRGLTSRFLYTNLNVYFDESFDTPGVRPELTEAWTRVVTKSLRAKHDQLGSQTQTEHIRLSDEARDLFGELFEKVSQQRKNDFSTEAKYSPEFQEWIGKYRGNIARIAANLHIANHYLGSTDDIYFITKEEMQAAITIGKYYFIHGEAAFTLMGAQTPDDSAKRTIKRIRDDIKRGCKEVQKKDDALLITRRSVMRLCKSFLHTTDDTQAILDFLEGYGYLVALREVGFNGRGRRPEMMYAINPSICVP